MAHPETMQALRVVASGPVTSFRYPHFVQGTQPTFEMPPPATLYGHVCSALGGWVDPAAFRVALHFTHQGRFIDFEHTHRFGRDPKLSPTRRELLFQPRLTLYLDRPDWSGVFRQPRYTVTLGRSQDLMQYISIENVTLIRADVAYLEHTLLPLDGSVMVNGYSARTLPRWISPDRYPVWGQYALVQARQPARSADAQYWIDPGSDTWRGMQRGVVWLTFT